MSLLLKNRFKSMLAGLKKSIGSKKAGMLTLFIVMMSFCIVVVEGMLLGIWFVVSPYLQTDYAWVYFALAGILAFALGIFGTVFTTQSQMYQAKDNELLLAMPIKPSHIILSRVLVLYLLTFVFTAVVMLPAGAVYCITCGASIRFVMIFLVSMVLISMVTQTITCLLGWVLQWLLAGFKHKALVAAFFMTVVMILYVIGINNLEDMTIALLQNGGKIANAVQSFAWPFYALGQACMGDMVQFLLFTLFSVGIFGAVMYVLARTFIKAMLSGSKTKTATKQKRDRKVRTPEAAICRKEARHFFGSTTYLVNEGMGLFMMVALVGAGILFKGKLVSVLETVGELNSMVPVILFSAMGVLASVTPISAPSVSLEGKHLWILRSMPVSGARVLKAKLRFHCIATVPIAFIGTLVLGLVYECSVLDALLASGCAAILHILCGVLGLVFNMCFPRFDWPTEAAPCKQSMALLCGMFGMMFLSIGVFLAGLLGIGALGADRSTLALVVITVVLALITYLLYILLVRWGGKKFEAL